MEVFVSIGSTCTRRVLALGEYGGSLWMDGGGGGWLVGGWISAARV